MSKPIKIRMCIVCRQRFAQDSLIRLKFNKEAKKITAYDRKGRSFYICKECIKGTKIIKVLIKNFHYSKEESTKIVEYLKGLYG